MQILVLWRPCAHLILGGPYSQVQIRSFVYCDSKPIAYIHAATISVLHRVSPPWSEEPFRHPQYKKNWDKTGRGCRKKWKMYSFYLLSLQLLKTLKCGSIWKSIQSPLLFKPKAGDMLLHSLKIPAKLKS